MAGFGGAGLGAARQGEDTLPISRRGKVWPGEPGPAWVRRGAAWILQWISRHGRARSGVAMPGWVRCGWARQGLLYRIWHGLAMRGTARRCKPRRGAAGPGMAWNTLSILARRGTVWRCETGPGVARHGTVWQGEDTLSISRRGLACPGQARRDEARPGKARQGQGLHDKGPTWRPGPVPRICPCPPEARYEVEYRRGDQWRPTDFSLAGRGMARRGQAGSGGAWLGEDT